MRVVVVGAGVMGLPTAACLGERGHEVVLLDRFGPANRLASSAGPTRIWRTAHPTRPEVRLARRAVAGWRDLEARSRRPLLLDNGLLWRGDDADQVLSAAAAEGVEAEPVDPARQQELFPALRPLEDHLVVWQPQAGTLLAADAVAATYARVAAAGVEVLVGETVTDVVERADGVRVVTDRAAYDGDVAVLAPGPFAGPLLARVGLPLELTPELGQVSYFTGPTDWVAMPSVIHGLSASRGDFYAMPTPGTGFKVGLDVPVRTLAEDDLDRDPDPTTLADTAALVAEAFPGLVPEPFGTHVCTWTMSPDGQMVLDRVGRVVVGCGDSGQAFKFLPLLGEVLADLAEHGTVDDDAATWGLSRFDAPSQ